MINKILFASMALLTACSHIDHKVCGTYKGVLPSADTAGITTTLTLNPDKTYTQKEVYADHEKSTFSESGNFALEDNIITLTTTDNRTTHYRIEGKNIRLLNDKKEMVTGNMSELYVLKHYKSCK